jgi:hypothetical protein
MLGAWFLPALGSRRPHEWALDARAEEHSAQAPVAVDGDGGHHIRREAWRGARGATAGGGLFPMLQGAVLLATGVVLLFILIGPPYLKVLMAGLFAYYAVRILWEFARG